MVIAKNNTLQQPQQKNMLHTIKQIFALLQLKGIR